MEKSSQRQGIIRPRIIILLVMPVLKGEEASVMALPATL